MKEEIENIIKKNLPENMETCTCEEDIGYHTKECNFLPFGFNDCLSQINTSLIADELLKAVVDKIEKEIEKFGDIWKLEKTAEETDSGCPSFIRINRDILQLLSNLSLNKDNKNTK